MFVVANEKQIILIAYNSVQVSTPQIKPLKYLINAKKKLQLNYIIHIISRFVTRSSTWAPQPTHIFLACFHGSHTVSCRINMTYIMNTRCFGLSNVEMFVVMLIKT